MIAISTTADTIVISQDGTMIFQGRLIDLVHRFSGSTESITITAEKRVATPTPQPSSGSVIMKGG